MDEKVLSAALAGLLHDIGKFSQRAGVGISETGNAEARRDYGYVHALASYDFMTAFVPKDWREDLSGIAYHHRPRNQREVWIQLADHLSASEREEDEDNRIPRMQSVFSQLAAYNGPVQYLPLKRLNPEHRDSLFPQAIDDNNWKAVSAKEYADLWQEFDGECKKRSLIAIADRAAYLETVFALLQEFTWCVPSAYWKSKPDVSLFDHLRTTAAIAACLAADDQSIDWCKNAKQSQEPICYLVGGDLSGLQAFIYTLASNGAAKSLRARSFYVQLISEAMAMAMLRELDLPLTNLLYVGGGGFQLFAPMKAKEQLPNIVRDLVDRLLEAHQGGLGLTVKWRPLAYSDFEDFGKARDGLGKKINQAKRQPFAAASPEKLMTALGEPMSEGGDPLRFCKVTGEDGNTVKKDKDGEYKSKFVLSLEDLGKLLPGASHIAFAPVPRQAPTRATDWQQALRVFGMEAQVVVRSDVAQRMSVDSGEFVRVWRLDATPEPEEREWLKPLGPAQVISYRPFARLTPLDTDGNPLTFDELAQPKNGGFERWGVLRLDVDNLGNLFKSGFGDKASLSFAIRLFFEGWLPQLAGRDLKQYLYIQYSGGDDVFVVGAWDVLPEFARRIRQSFGEYAAGNPHLTLSGGMTMVDAGYPLYQAAQQAGDAEDAAKSVDGKDAFTFLDHPLKWSELQATQERAYRLMDNIKAKHLPHSALQTLLALQARKNGKPKPMYGPWMWMAAYQLTRLTQQIKDNDTREHIRELQQKYLSPGADIETIGLAARWAQYLTRGG
ncbi:MAG: type III-A CRISPR-associated protein Cas10/Csm1 [Chloroflexi bacterium]|nr:type III-A CRISPR-associated protein Cas10/Csm1 [Chloroflexota bacterium]